MQLTFVDPGADYMVDSVMLFQEEGETPYWSEALYYYYPEIDKEKALSLPFEGRKAYVAGHIRDKYQQLKPLLGQKVADYAAHWQHHQGQIAAALSDGFELDVNLLLNDLRANISLNPVSPRFLKEKYFEVFYLNSQRGAMGIAIHEIIHFLWFHVWQQVFVDDPKEYERPHIKWVLSEMVVESIMSDARLSTLNPYYPRENGGCVYPYFQDMVIEGIPALETLDKMYRQHDIRGFMQAGYDWCLQHEEAIQAHIKEAEKKW